MGVSIPNAWTNFDEIWCTTTNSDSMTVTWSNIKISIIRNGGRAFLENIRHALTRLKMDGLGRNMGRHIPLCSHYFKCYNSSSPITMGPTGTTLGRLANQADSAFHSFEVDKWVVGCNYTVVQKNEPTSADYNYDPVQSILIIFRKLFDNYHKSCPVVKFSTSPHVCCHSTLWNTMLILH